MNIEDIRKEIARDERKVCSLSEDAWAYREHCKALLTEVERLRATLNKESHRIIWQKNWDLRDTEGKLCDRITELEAEIDQLRTSTAAQATAQILARLDDHNEIADRNAEIEELRAEIDRLNENLKVSRELSADRWHKCCDLLKQRAAAMAEVERLRRVALEWIRPEDHDYFLQEVGDA